MLRHISTKAGTVAEIGSYLESCMGLELVRVEQNNPDRDYNELVVVGLD